MVIIIVNASIRNCAACSLIPEFVTAHFSLTAFTAYFTKRGPVSDHRCNSAELTIGIAVSGRDFGLARHIGQCINNILKIERVLVPEKPYADLSWAAKLV